MAHFPVTRDFRPSIKLEGRRANPIDAAWHRLSDIQPPGSSREFGNEIRACNDFLS